MESQDVEVFAKRLLNKSNDNPFRYPEPPPRPPFIVGGEQIVEWFKQRYQQSIREGYNISFVVGEPGAGKSHFLSHLEYLFYEGNSLRGIYVVYGARREEIDEKDILTTLFLNDDVLERLRQIIQIENVSNSKIRRDTRQNIIKLLEGELQVDSLRSNALHQMAEGLSELLVKEDAGICIAVDNVDEYFRFISEKYEKEYGKEQAKAKAITSFFGTLRSVTTGMRQLILLLACTTPVYTEIENAGADRTHARRIEFQAERLQELTSTQSLTLVHKYLDWWSLRHDTHLPTIQQEECAFLKPTGEKTSIYPFSKTAIEYFHKVTGKFAGDIVCVCNQCINDMRTEHKISVVKNEVIFHALEKAKKRRPQLIPKIDILDSERPRILKKLLKKKLNIIEQQTKHKYQNGINDTTLIDSVERYTDELGITKTEVEPAKEYRDYARIIPISETGRIWEYKDTKIFVKYVLGSQSPLRSKIRRFGYDRRIEVRDCAEIISYIEDDKVTHGLFIRRWADTYSDAAARMSRMGKLQGVIEETDLDATIYKIIGAVEDTSEDKRDLIRYVDGTYVNLKATLDSLVERTLGGIDLEEIRKRDKDTMRRF